MTNRLFPSCPRSDDKEAAARIATFLEQDGPNAWQDQCDIRSEDSAWPQIEVARLGAEHLVVVVIPGPFLRATRDSAMLVTTRSEGVLPRDAVPVQADRLQTEDARALLASGIVIRDQEVTPVDGSCRLWGR